MDECGDSEERIKEGGFQSTVKSSETRWYEYVYTTLVSAHTFQKAVQKAVQRVFEKGGCERPIGGTPPWLIY